MPSLTAVATALRSRSTADRLLSTTTYFTSGANESPYRLDLCIKPGNCKPWKKFFTQWTGRGAYMFNGGEISSQDMSVCEGMELSNSRLKSKGR